MPVSITFTLTSCQSQTCKWLILLILHPCFSVFMLDSHVPSLYLFHKSWGQPPIGFQALIKNAVQFSAGEATQKGTRIAAMSLGGACVMDATVNSGSS